MTKLLEVEKAQTLVDQAADQAARRSVAMASEEAIGFVLAESIRSDIDIPPYRKALMDGFAVGDEDATAGSVLQVVDEITAGSQPQTPIRKGESARIMTGATIPLGANLVIKQEDTKILEDGKQIELLTTASSGANLMEAGFCAKQGETVLDAGHRISAQEIGFLHEIGAAHVEVIQPPSVAILATGNELVKSTEYPGLGQIRNTNASLLKALVQRDGGVAELLEIAKDTSVQIEQQIQQGLLSDILILSGGVSVGVRDLVPSCLKSAGVSQVFHGVQLKPGKPLWFGIYMTTPQTKLVFGLPGNPMSNLVCYELFVRRAIERIRGVSGAETIEYRKLVAPFEHRSGRRTFHPSKLIGTDSVDLLPWKGSADQRVMTKADSFCDLATGPRLLAAGEEVPVRRI